MVRKEIILKSIFFKTSDGQSTSTIFLLFQSNLTEMYYTLLHYRTVSPNEIFILRYNSQGKKN